LDEDEEKELVGVGLLFGCTAVVVVGADGTADGAETSVAADDNAAIVADSNKTAVAAAASFAVVAAAAADVDGAV
jgi:hypothetical protein